MTPLATNARVLVTGASGFVGRALVPALVAAGYAVRAAARSPMPPQQGVEPATLPDLSQPADWGALLHGVDLVVHLAAIAHISAGISEDTYDRVNHRASADLAAAAAVAGIRRLVLMSSIRAQTGPFSPAVLTEESIPEPVDAYGRAKLAAERAVAISGVPFSILRPVVVYGPQAKGNIATLARLAATPWPLPLASLTNRRSLLSLDNLVSATLFALENAAAEGQTYVVADPEPLAVAEMVAVLREAQGRPPRLFAFPPGMFAAALTLTGRASLWERIGGSFVADPAKLMAAGWRPTVRARDGLIALARKP